MRALITGATGFVGPHLSRHLLGCGDDVCAISYKGSSELPSEVRVSEIDICDLAAVRDFFERVRPAAVYHLAGVSSVAQSRSNPQLTLDVNVNGTAKVFAAASQLAQKPRILIVSTSQVYGDADGTVTEATPVRPTNPYASSKAMSELVPGLFDYSEFVIVRPFNHSGPGQTQEFVLSSFAAQIASMEAGRSPAVLKVGDIDVERDFLDVRDVVTAYRLLIERGTCERVYNLASGTPCSLRSILDIFQRSTPIQFRIEVDSSRQRGVQSRTMTAVPEALRSDTGWIATVPVRETVQDLLDWWRRGN